MNIVLTVIVTVFIFGVLIALHELGHYLVARAFGVGIREYSIGMGPKIWQRQGKYNKFTLRALPIGGYVDMVGENADDDGSALEDAGKTPLNKKPIWQRMLIVLAGPVTNVVLGLVIMSVIVLFQDSLYGTEIDYFGSAAISDDSMVYLTADYGDFAKGDIIFAADGKAATANDGGLDGFLSAYGDAGEFLVIRKNSTDFVISRFVSVNFEKLKLETVDGYVCASEDVYNEDGALAVQKNDIIYSIDGLLCSKDTDVDTYAQRYGTAENVLILKRYGSEAVPLVIKEDDIKKAPLAASGALMVGDKVVKVGSYGAHVYADLSYGIFNDGIDPVDITVIRDGKKQVVKDVVFYKGSEKGVIYGEIDFAPSEVPKTFGSVCYNAVFQPLSTLRMTLDNIVQTFTGRYGVEALSGPVGIGGQINEVLSSDTNRLDMLFTLIVMITLSLGLCNLLPLPVLDGGRLLLYAIEGIRRKPLPPKVEQGIMTVSMLLVLALMVFVMFKDIIGLI